jgi:hypothetical protein
MSFAQKVWRVVHSRLRRGPPPRDQTKWLAAALGGQRPGPPPFIALRVHYARKAARCFCFSVERRAATFIEVRRQFIAGTLRSLDRLA